MEFKVRRPGAKHRALQMWHKWFAWFPIRIGKKKNRLIWLEYVMRRGEYWTSWGEDGYTWEYRRIA